MKVERYDLDSFGADHAYIDQFAQSPQPFYDMWERWMKQHPNNLQMVHHRGSRSYAELFIWHQDTGRMGRIDHAFADLGRPVQLPEQLFKEFYHRALSLTIPTDHQPNPRVLLVRYDNEVLTPETWMNAPFRPIEGHSWHKIPQHQLTRDFITDPLKRIWHKSDYYNALFAGSIEPEAQMSLDDL